MNNTIKRINKQYADSDFERQGDEYSVLQAC